MNDEIIYILINPYSIFSLRITSIGIQKTSISKSIFTGSVSPIGCSLGKAGRGRVNIVVLVQMILRDSDAHSNTNLCSILFLGHAVIDMLKRVVRHVVADDPFGETVKQTVLQWNR